MKNIAAVLIFLLLSSACWSQLEARLPLTFQLTSSNGTAEAERNILLQISVLTNYSDSLLFRELHQVMTNKAGIASIIIGDGEGIFGSLQGINWPAKRSKINLKYRFSVTDDWKDGGEQSVTGVPFALVAGKTAGLDWTFTSGNLVLPTGRIAIGADTMPFGIEFGEGKKLLLSSTQPELSASTLIKMDCPADTSKPALLWYDSAYVGKIALVAHDYLHFPWRRHQHFSLEVSDNSGAIQTRFEFPWGVDTIQIQNHSADFQINDGYFAVGDKYQAGTAEMNGNMWIYGNARLQLNDETENQTLGNLFTGVKRTNSPANVTIRTKKELKAAQIKLFSGNEGYSFKNYYQQLKIQDKDYSTFMVFDTETGYVKIGSLTPDEKLSVNGNIQVTQGHAFMIAKGGGYAEHFEAQEPIEAGTVVGICITTGKARAYQTGDEFVGISLEDPEKGMGGTFNGQVLVCITGTPFINTSKLTTEKNTCFTIDHEAIGILIDPNHVLLR